MTEVKKSNTSSWILFLVSFTVLILLLTFHSELFWLGLPGSVTGFALLMDWI